MRSESIKTWLAVTAALTSLASASAAPESERRKRADPAVPSNQGASASPSGLTSAITSMLSVDTAPCTPDGHCVCSVAVPPACSVDEEYQAIVSLRARIDEVNVRASGSLLLQLTANLTLLQSKVERLQVSLQIQSVALSQTELNILRAEMALVATLISQIQINMTSNLTLSLRREIDAISSSLVALEGMNPVAVQTNLQAEINALRKRLLRCKVDTATVGGTPFIGDTLPFNESYAQCGSARNITVGPPTTHKHRASQSWWYKDPKPLNDFYRHQIYEVRGLASYTIQLTSWANYSDFSSARSDNLLRQSTCSFSIYGSKNVVLNNNLYYFENVYEKTVWKKDLATCSVTRLSFSIDTSDFNLYANRQTYADLNYDETGLYLTYTDAARDGDLVISKINPDTMAVINTWETGHQKSTLANVFFVCGRMYTTDSFNSNHLTGKQFGFDTTTGEEFFVDLDVESRFGDVRHLSYNPREHLLFGFDNQHLVTYPVTFP